MGVGYTVSSLHKINSYEPVEGAPLQPPPNNAAAAILLAMPGARWDGRPKEIRSPRTADIVLWRDWLNQRYDRQMGEKLAWNEDSDFECSEDIGLSADVLLRYVAAILDQEGPNAVRSHVGTSQPLHRVLTSVFRKAEQKSFAGRFPHLLLGANYWFPYPGHLIIEEPNWDGNIERYGSLIHLAEEIDQVRECIISVDSGATTWTPEKSTPVHSVTAAAWQASETVARLCRLAILKNLPLWTTG